MSDIRVAALAFGNVASNTLLNDVRLIMPLTSFLQIADVILSRKLGELLGSHWLPSPCIMECARPRTQVMDIVAAAALFLG